MLYLTFYYEFDVFFFQKDKIIVSDLLTPAEKEWIKAMNGQKSMISRLFFGQLRSTITCSTCRNNSTTYETFNSLTMSLPSSTKCTLDVRLTACYKY